MAAEFLHGYRCRLWCSTTPALAGKVKETAGCTRRQVPSAFHDHSPRGCQVTALSDAPRSNRHRVTENRDS
eukprot:3933925-Rhodomonas_salina.1